MNPITNPFEEISRSLERLGSDIRALAVKIDDLVTREADTPPPDRAMPPLRWYSVNAAAEFLDKTPYTIREWCRLGRVNARSLATRKGGGETWPISAGEIDRHLNDGLLPIDPGRNRA